jgi:hypothetical protein
MASLVAPCDFDLESKSATMTNDVLMRKFGLKARADLPTAKRN